MADTMEIIIIISIFALSFIVDEFEYEKEIDAKYTKHNISK